MATPRDASPAFDVDERVYYFENGPNDTGIVVAVHPRRQKTKGPAVTGTGRVFRYDYEVKWDNSDPTDYYTEGQLRPVGSA